MCFRWHANSAAECHVKSCLISHDTCIFEGKIVKIEQNLAAAEQAGNKEKERSLCDLLLSLNNQLNQLDIETDSAGY